MARAMSKIHNAAPAGPDAYGDVPPPKTVALVVHQSEIESGDLDGNILPRGLSDSPDFQEHLQRIGKYWFFHENHRRVLLLSKEEDDEGAAPSDIRESYRQLAAVAHDEITKMMIDEVEFLFSDLVASPSLIGDFENKFFLSNYNNLWASKIEKDLAIGVDDKVSFEEIDDRYWKPVSKYKIACSDVSVRNSTQNKFMKYCANASLTAQHICNARGSVANPDYLQDKLWKVAE